MRSTRELTGHLWEQKERTRKHGGCDTKMIFFVTDMSTHIHTRITYTHYIIINK